MRLYMCIMRSRDWGGVFEPIEPPVEKPEIPTTPPSTEDLITIKIEDDIMAVVGTKTWNAIAYGNGKYVAVGDSGYITTSTDGVNWTTPQRPIDDDFTNDIYAITYADGVFIAAGRSCIYTSNNGINWQSEYAGVDSYVIRAILYHNGLCIAVGSVKVGSYFKSAILISNNKGESWITAYQTNAMEDFYAVTYANGKYHAISGTYGYYTTSADGITWESQYQLLGSSSAYYPLKIVSDVNGNLIVVAKHPYIYYVANGERLAKQIIVDPTDKYSSPNFRDAIYRNGTFIMIGDGYMMNKAGTTLMHYAITTTSADGITWTIPAIMIDNNGNDVVQAPYNMIEIQ